VTGSVDVPLTDRGREQGHELKRRVGDIAVFTAPNARSRETGAIISPGAQSVDWLKPWALGAFEGRELDEARAAINRLITDTPDKSPGVSKYSGKPGDTFNEVSRRLVGGVVAQRNDMSPGARVLNITSGRALHIIHAAAVTGFKGISVDELQKRHFSKPGDLFLLTSDYGLVKISANAIGRNRGQYFAQHGETSWNEGKAASE